MHVGPFFKSKISNKWNQRSEESRPSNFPLDLSCFVAVVPTHCFVAFFCSSCRLFPRIHRSRSLFLTPFTEKGPNDSTLTFPQPAARDLKTTFTWAIHTHITDLNGGHVQPCVMCVCVRDVARGKSERDGVFWIMCHRIKNNSFVNTHRLGCPPQSMIK